MMVINMPPEFSIPDAATLEEKVDLLIRMTATSLQNQAKVAKLEAKMVSLEDTVKKMSKEIASMKDQNNAREQLLRGHYPDHRDVHHGGGSFKQGAQQGAVKESVREGDKTCPGSGQD
jgi:hypothetical protein